MRMALHIRNCAHSMREFVWPHYKPERHYMRGPGPACKARGGEQDSR